MHFLDGDMSRFARLRRMLGIKPSSNSTVHYPSANSEGGDQRPETLVNLDELRKDCWLGIPHKVLNYEKKFL